MKPAPILALALLAAACTPMEWVRSDVTAEQAEADAQLCSDQAWRETAWSYRYNYSSFGPWLYRDPFGRPLVGPLGASSLTERSMDEARLADFCMRAKGYHRAPKN
jgi:hypothetical protein